MGHDNPFDPFGDDDKTRIWRSPSPENGAPSPALETPRPPPRTAPLPTPPMTADLGAVFGGDNPVVVPALPLLALVSRLATLPAHRDINGLQQQLADEIRAFENKVLRQGLIQEQVRMASYTLCSLLDETVMNTPWGAQSAWGHQSLLIRFHREAWGGEKVFQIIDHLRRQPAQNLHLIELCYLCLSLGFQGKYRIMQNGLNELEQYRAELYQLIQRVRGDHERSLSPRWQGLKDVRGALARYVPLWVVAAAAGAVLISAYLWFLFSLSDISDATRAHLADLGNEQIKTAAPLPPPVPPPPPVPHRAERFTVLLRDEIDKGMVKVIDDRTLLICDSFPSGGDRIDQKFVPMLKKIAGELLATDTVEVTGHTDDVPIRTARFPSNWDLSVARAQHVADILRTSATTTAGMTVRGRGKDLPLASNDTPEHRAQNRRVDILIQ